MTFAPFRSPIMSGSKSLREVSEERKRRATVAAGRKTIESPQEGLSGCFVGRGRLKAGEEALLVVLEAENLDPSERSVESEWRAADCGVPEEAAVRSR